MTTRFYVLKGRRVATWLFLHAHPPIRPTCLPQTCTFGVY